MVLIISLISLLFTLQLAVHNIQIHVNLYLVPLLLLVLRQFHKILLVSRDIVTVV